MMSKLTKARIDEGFKAPKKRPPYFAWWTGLHSEGKGPSGRMNRVLEEKGDQINAFNNGQPVISCNGPPRPWQGNRILKRK